VTDDSVEDFEVPEAPRDGLMRSMPFEVVRADDDGDGLTLEGYAAVFNSPTRIDSWEGKFDETIAPGAFKKALRERTPVLMFNHGQHPLIGDMPLGAIKSAREDSQGLHVVARLSDNWLIQPVRDAIREGAVSGMSFRFSVVKDDWAQPTRKGGVPQRTLREVKVPELGPVVFPAYADTSVGVRSQEVAGMLADPAFRAELARALLLGTPEGAARQGTPQDAAAPQEPVTTPRITDQQRRRAAALIQGVNPNA
jgi:HK97 family phage prohead protease